MYAMLGTRPDLAFAVASLSQFSSNPGQTHWDAIKHVLRYMRGTQDYRLTYGSQGGASLLFDGYCDSAGAPARTTGAPSPATPSCWEEAPSAGNQRSSPQWRFRLSRPSTWLHAKPPEKRCGGRSCCTSSA